MYEFLKYDESPTRQKRRANIIDKSMDIFIRDGIGPLTMTSLANEINVPYRSLYYYYKNKEELTVDIQLVAISKMIIRREDLDHLYLHPSSNFKKMTAYDHVRNFLYSTYYLHMKNKREIKYITTFDYYFINEYPSPKYNEVLSTFIIENPLIDLLKQGKEDGSIRIFSNDIQLMSNTILQSMLSYTQKIIHREHVMSSETLESRGDLEVFINIILAGLKKN